MWSLSKEFNPGQSAECNFHLARNYDLLALLLLCGPTSPKGASRLVIFCFVWIRAMMPCVCRPVSRDRQEGWQKAFDSRCFSPLAQAFTKGLRCKILQGSPIFEVGMRSRGPRPGGTVSETIFFGAMLLLSPILCIILIRVLDLASAENLNCVNCVRLFSNPVPASAIWDRHEKVDLCECVAVAVNSIPCVCASAVTSACSGNAAFLHLVGRTGKTNGNDKKK